MAPQHMDALTSFVFLTENLPNWAEKIKDLAEHTATRHNEFAAEYRRLVKQARPKKAKSPSLASNRSNDRSVENREGLARSKSSQESVRLNPLEAGNKHLFSSVRDREKNTGVSFRSGASGPRRFRQKHAVVIYYDGHVQTSLEAMVRNISTARNNLRKGKKSRDLMKSPMFSFNNFTSSIPDFKPPSFFNTVNINPKAGIDGPTQQPPADVEKCFDLADKLLEQAQNLCETAAHQFLRDGDTSLELKNSKEKLEAAVQIATDAIAKLREEEDSAEDDPEDVDTTVKDTNDFKFTLPTTFPTNKSYIPRADHSSAIEVDSADEDGGTLGEDFDKEIDIGRFRCNMRSTVVPV